MAQVAGCRLTESWKTLERTPVQSFPQLVWDVRLRHFWCHQETDQPALPPSETRVTLTDELKRRSIQAKCKLSGVLVRGYYKEKIDGEPKPVIAYFVPLGTGYSGLKEPEFRTFLMELAERFNQETILYSPGGGRPAQELTVAEEKVMKIFKRLKFNPSVEDLRNAWSEVRRHKFVFLSAPSETVPSWAGGPTTPEGSREEST
jgi:hypothetical protein